MRRSISLVAALSMSAAIASAQAQGQAQVPVPDQAQGQWQAQGWSQPQPQPQPQPPPQPQPAATGTAEDPDAFSASMLPPGQIPAPAPSAAPVADPASTPPPSPAPLPNELRTRVSGRLTSEIFLSQRPRMKSIGDGRYAIRSNKVFPFYETIQLRADEVGARGLSIHFQGWAGVDLADIYFDKRVVADPTYLYLQYRDYGFDLRLGRQMVFTGATRGLHIDGLYASYETPVHLGIEGLGGLVVSPDIGPDWYREQPRDASYDDFGMGYTDWQRPGDYAVGGRLFYRLASRVSAGVSILNVTEWGEVDRRLAGVDLDLTPVRWFGATGNAVLDMMTVDLQEANAAFDFYPIEPLSFGVDYRHANPTLFLSQMSIFSVFSDESYDAFGGEVRGRPIDWLQLVGSYHQRLYGYVDLEDGDGDREYGVARDTGYDLGVGASARFGKKRNGLVRLDYSRTTESDLGVHEVRVGAIVPIVVDGLRAAANAYIDFFDEVWNSGYTGTDGVSGASNVRFGYTGDVGLYYGNGTIEAGGSLAHSSTPYARQETRGMLKFVYNFAVDFRERGRP